MPSEMGANCPECGVSLPPNAVLCIACGYHLKLGYHLATATGDDVPRPPALHMNPYAAPTVIDPPASPNRSSNPDFDLTEKGAARAKAIVNEAGSVRLLCGLACICAPVWVLMLPWFSYRLYCWHDLNSTYAELRNPNSFSQHGELAADFVNAKSKIIVGMVVGGILWLIMIGTVVLETLLEGPTVGS